MRILTLALAGTLLTAAGLAASAATAQPPGSLREAGRASSHARSLPSGSLGEARGARHSGAPQLSPHIGLPGISGFGAPGISPHIGLPGITGLPSLSDDRRRHGRGHGQDDEFFDPFVGYYEGDGDGYVDTIPMADQFGFFSEGGVVTMEGDMPVYHYNRGYPYEFYRGGSLMSGRRSDAGLRCRVSTVWDDVERRDVTVRVCAPA